MFEFAGENVTAKEHAYVVAPPALHPSGVQYRIESSGTGIAECDYEALVNAAGAARKRTHEKFLTDPEAKVTKGNRHPQLVSLAGTCRHKGFDFDTALDVVQRFNAQRCEPPYSEAAVEAKVRDVYERYDPGPPPEPVEEVEFDGNLAGILDAVQKNLTRFLVIGAPESCALSLWIAHTHAFRAAEVTPYIEIRSPEKRCGKSTLLRVLASIVARPRMSADMSDAVLYRLVAHESPTLLWDEVDGLFGSKARDREDTRKLLNAGFEAGATAWRMGGESKTTFEEFNVFCPKAFASIGKLPDTLTDRSITIHMLRKHRREKVERARRRDVREAGRPLHDQLAAWAVDAGGDLVNARPELPDELNDREQDFWEPLLAIADAAGGRWPDLARKTAVHLSAVAAQDTGLLEELLAGIASAFEAVKGAHLSTVDLIESLCRDEEAPWRGWWWDDREANPTKEAPRKLAAKLRPVGIRSTKVRVGESSVRGYRVDMFEDAFERFAINRNMRNTGNNGLSNRACVPHVPDVPHIPGTPPDPGTALMDELRAYYEDAQ